nr:exodeoxyribonuclease VII small subunit [uncultured Anaerostipes sp.]
MAKKEFNVDQGFEQLDQILGKLENDDIKLSDAVKLYSEGVGVIKKCKDSLDQVEKELIILDEDGESNEL